MRTLLLAVLLPLAACRDLDFPDPATSGARGPSVTFLRPSEEGQPLLARELVELDVQDPQGVAEVTLACGPDDEGGARALLHHWGSGPFAATVDLRPCGAFLPEGAGVVRLRVQARDRQGNFNGEPELPVRLDLSAPVLSLAPLPSVGSKETVTLRVTTDRELAGPPDVSVEGQALQVTGDGLSFQAVYTAPPLGFQRYTGPPPLPKELLEEVERTLTIQVSGRAKNGNETRLERPLLVSRVKWDRSVPGRLVAPDPALPAAFPVASPEGVHLPLRFEDEQRWTEWTPGLLRAADGSFNTFPASAFEGATLAAHAFDGDGNVLLVDGTLRAKLVDSDGQTLRTFVGRLKDRTAPLIRAGARLCEYSAVGNCTSGHQHQVNCLGAADEFATAGQVLAESIRGGTPFAVASGDALAFFQTENLSCAGQSTYQTFSTRAVTGAAVSRTTPLIGSLYRVVSLGAGTFAAVGTSAATAELATFEVSNGAVVRQLLGKDYRPELVLAGVNDRLVTLRHPTLDSTELEVWAPGAGQRELVVPLEGRFQLAPTLLSGEHNLVRGPAGELAVALKWHEYGRAVLVLGADLSPRWLYRYPIASADAQLVGGGPQSDLYLVDYENRRVVALARPW